MTVDRQKIINEVLFGLGTPDEGPIPTAFLSGAQNTTGPDIKAAGDLLEKNGWLFYS